MDGDLQANPAPPAPESPSEVRIGPYNLLTDSVSQILVWLTLPIIFNNLLNVSVSVTDVWFAGMIVGPDGAPNPEATAAIGAASQLFDLLVILVIAIGGGVAILVAHLFGRGEGEKASALVRDALVSAGLMAALTLLPLGYLVSPALLDMMNLTGSTHAMALEYLHWRLPASVMMAMGFVMGSAWTGAGDVRTPVVILVIMNGVNIICSYVLMFGVFGLPEMGLAGAGAGSFIGRTVGILVGLYILVWGQTMIQLRRGLGPFDYGAIVRVLQLGLPRSMEGVVRTGSGFLLFTLVGVAALNVPSLVESQGADHAPKTAIAAYTVVSRVRMVPIFVGLAFMAAMSTLVGQCLGAKHPDRATEFTGTAIKMSASFMAVVGLIMFLIPHQLIALFNQDPGVIEVGVPLFRILAVVEPVVAVVLVLSGTLRGGGDTVYPLLATLTANVLILLAAGYTAVYVFDGTLITLWMIIAGTIVGQMTLLAIRYLGGKWKTIEV